MKPYHMRAVRIIQCSYRSSVGGQNFVHLSNLLVINTYPANIGAFKNLECVVRLLQYGKYLMW